MIREGWAKKVGTEDVNGPNEANVYEITPQGRKKAKALEKELAIPMSKRERDREVQRLREKVDQLEALVERSDGISGSSMPATDTTGSVDPSRVEEMTEQLEENTEQIEELDSTVDEHESEMHRLHSSLTKIAKKIGAQ